MRPILNLSISLVLSFSLFSGSSALAQGHLQTWNTSNREKSQRLTSAAMTALNKGQLSQASRLLLDATQADPTDAVPFAALGMTYIRQGKNSEALDALKKSYQISKNAETLISSGFAYFMDHDYDAAIASWSKALERDPKLVELNGDIGFAFLRKGEFAKADEAFRALIRYRPSSQLAYQGLANLNYLAGNFSAARKAAEHAQSIQSYYPVLLLLAKLDFLQGDPKTGQKRVSEWLRASSGKKTLLRSMTDIGYSAQHDFHWDPFLSDNFDTGRLLLARAQSSGKNKSGQEKQRSSGKGGKNSAVLSNARQAQFASPKDFYITRELALVEMAEGDNESAANHFRTVLQLCPACRVDWLHLARALAAQGKNSEASYAVREFQQQRPSEAIAGAFTELAKGDATVIPDLSPSVEGSSKRAPGESGF
ncbi:MAG: tetratricopeptide repeat protein [Candidatus Obscuribacterales bacterium]|nr:tetratricopeptide repeat protein [Candidatus Obscuribacterales bacterium]